MKKNFFLGIGILCSFLLAPPAVLAIAENPSEGCFLGPAGSGVTDVLSFGCLTQVVFNVIGYAMAFLGAVALLFLIYGSIKFVISRGDPKAIEGAQKTMTYAVLGVIIVLGSFIIINIITTALGYPGLLTNFSFFQGGYKQAIYTGP